MAQSMKNGVDDSMVRMPEGFSLGMTAWHERSKRTVKLIERQLGDGWLCEPIDGGRVFYEHSEFLLPNASVIASLLTSNSDNSTKQ